MCFRLHYSKQGTFQVWTEQITNILSRCMMGNVVNDGPCYKELQTETNPLLFHLKSLVIVFNHIFMIIIWCIHHQANKNCSNVRDVTVDQDSVEPELGSRFCNS